MSGLDLYEKTVDDNYSRLAPVSQPEASAWDGFARGTALYTMRGFAAAASGIDLLGSVGPTAQDWITGGTEARDRYFKEHEEYWGKSVDYWTPAPGEVGAAGQIAGSMLSTLPMVIANPALAVTTTQTSVAEDLVKKGVDPAKAQAVGATQALGLGIGIYMPILGNNLWQRLLVGGAGFNVVQGAVTRGVSQAILQGTPAAEDFHMLNAQDLTLDALLGMAFGGFAHISPAMRAQGKEFWDRVDQWRSNLKPEEIDALATLRQAQHANVDSLPGRPVAAGDIDAHVERLRTAVEQLSRDEPVNVTDMPKANVTPDEARMTEAVVQAKELTDGAESARREEGLPKPDQVDKALAKPSEEPAPLVKPIAVKPGAKPEKADPLSIEADRVATQHPDMLVHLGQDASGNPITTKLGDFLSREREAAKQAADDSNLFAVAAECLMGNM